MDSSRQATDAQQEQVLKVQKENLAAQVKVQKTRLAELETQLQQLQQRESICQQSLLHTEDLWNQLQRNLQIAAEHAGIVPPVTPPQEDQPIHGFLQSLVSRDAEARKSLQAKLTSLQDQLSSNEQMLSSKASRTQVALAGILDRIQAMKAGAESVLAAASAGAADQLASAYAEKNLAIEKLQEQQSLCLATQAQLDQAVSRHGLLQSRISDLQNHLLDSEDSLDTVRKKLAKQNVGSSIKGAGGAGSSSDGAARLSGDLEAAVELQQLQQLLEQRTSDLEHQKSIGSKLERHVHLVNNCHHAGFISPNKTLSLFMVP